MKLYSISFLILLVFSCSSKRSGGSRNPSTDGNKSVSENDKVTPKAFFITDTAASKNPFVKLTNIDSEGAYQIEWGNESRQWSDNLVTLTDGQGYRMPPTVQWFNDKWICLITNYTGPHSQHLFLPLLKEKTPVFFAEDIEYADSLNNFVCYINSGSDSSSKSVTWTIQSLMTDQAETFQLQIDDQYVCYPWYRNIYKEGDYIVIEYAENLVKKINISNYRS